MTIAIGSDHAGFSVKSELILYLQEKDHTVLDLGALSDASVDYPDFAHKVGIAVVSGKAERGIVICGTGIGISIAANKIKGIRAALCTSPTHAEMSRKHNDANVLALGARLTELKTIKKIIDVWVSTNFEGGRHQKRVNKIERVNHEHN